MNNWYVAQVMTGKEQEVCNCLNSPKCVAIAPVKVVEELRHGTWRLMRRRVFPGYVFLNCSMDARLYLYVKKQQHILRLLGDGMGTPVSDEQMTSVLTFHNDGHDFGISIARKSSNGYEILDGPLKKLAEKISHVESRQRKAGMDVQLPGETLRIYVGVTIVEDEQKAPIPKKKSEK
ncbi:hypothetical protein LJC42_06965 [Eubacteriales bacterium OttesenSCG-928-K08]|nr:hypothetical protein [Eubacteriales bacterium OttesenSCG-928-K08]